MKKICCFLFGVILLISGCCRNCNLSNKKTVDLTYSFDEKTIYWPTEKGFHLEKEREGVTEQGYYYSANKFCAPEHGGTHIDAPIHFSKNGKTLDQIPIKSLIGNGILVDVYENCFNNKDYLVTVNDFLKWEKKYGKIPQHSIVLLKTGFARYWTNRKDYLGTKETGTAAVEKLHFPGLHPDAAQWLVKNRFIKAVGLDTASIDYGQSRLFESHIELLKNNVLIFENLTNLDKLPEKDFEIIALPMKIKGGSGGPLRIIAILKH